jgi:hypothetical protein
MAETGENHQRSCPLENIKILMKILFFKCLCLLYSTQNVLCAICVCKRALKPLFFAKCLAVLESM